MAPLGFLLVPRWGVVGAAASAEITNLASNLWFLWEVPRRLAMSPYNISYSRLFLPLAGAFGVLLIAHKFLFELRSGWMLAALALVVAYTAFICIAVGFGLDSDDRIILNAIWSRISGKFALLGAGA